MNTNKTDEWRPKVGERVGFCGALVLDCGAEDSVPFLVRTPDGVEKWFAHSQLSPLPATPEPRKPWEVLREAAKLMQEAHPSSYYGDLLLRASFLENAAAPKPPTLAEAVRAYVEYMDDPKSLCAMMEALTRAENGA